MKPKSKKPYAKTDDQPKNSKAEMIAELDKLKRTGPLLSQDGQAAVERLTELVKALD